MASGSERAALLPLEPARAALSAFLLGLSEAAGARTESQATRGPGVPLSHAAWHPAAGGPVS